MSFSLIIKMSSLPWKYRLSVFMFYRNVVKVTQPFVARKGQNFWNNNHSEKHKFMTHIKLNNLYALFFISKYFVQAIHVISSGLFSFKKWSDIVTYENSILLKFASEDSWFHIVIFFDVGFPLYAVITKQYLHGTCWVAASYYSFINVIYNFDINLLVFLYYWGNLGIKRLSHVYVFYSLEEVTSVYPLFVLTSEDMEVKLGKRK